MFRARNLWPDIGGFRDTMLVYFGACHDLGRSLHRAFALDLGLAPGFFEDKLDRPMAALRLLHYPEAPARPEAGQLGAGEHTDYGCVTLLATDGVGGLEVRTRAGEWLKAPRSSGAFVCNIGDCLMRWTNDIYVSTPHRVVSPSGRERYSIAFFLDPNPDADIACLPGCASAARPARYAPIRGDAFLLSRLSPTYEKSGLGQPEPRSGEARQCGISARAFAQSLGSALRECPSLHRRTVLLKAPAASNAGAANGMHLASLSMMSRRRFGPTRFSSPEVEP